jgi:hypothetical protein
VPVGHAVSSTEADSFSTDSAWPPPPRLEAKICSSSPWLVSSKSPAKRRAYCGTVALESGSVSARWTVEPCLEPLVFAIVAAASSENSGWILATWPAARVTR